MTSSRNMKRILYGSRVAARALRALPALASGKRGGKRLTPIRRANLRRGGTGRKVLGVKRPFRIKVRKMAKARKRVLVKQWIRSKRGKKRAIRYQHLRVVIRARK